MTFHLLVATPEKILFDGMATAFIAPGTSGYFEVLAGHAALISSLRHGHLTITDENYEQHAYNLSGGLVEVAGNDASILVDHLLE